MKCHARGCPPLKENSRVCHCAGCHRTFSSLTLFDSHQDWSQGWSSGVACKAPGELGLVRAANGVWWIPESLTALTEKVTRMNQARAA